MSAGIIGSFARKGNQITLPAVDLCQFYPFPVAAEAGYSLCYPPVIKMRDRTGCPTPVKRQLSLPAKT
jgi:hypothetical protein